MADRSDSLRVRAFGRLKIGCKGKAVSKFPTRKVEELLAYLLLNPDVGHSREKLVEMLWPGAPPENGRARLSTTLWRLRTILNSLNLPPEICLETTNESVSFLSQPDQFVDVDRFLALLASAESEVDQGKAMAHLQEARSLFKGDLLDGIYSEWCLIVRERLSRDYLRLLGQMMAAHIENGAFNQAIETGQAILDQDPLREEVHRALMICYERSGRRPEALRQFQRCANLLIEEMGILPLPETIDVYRQMIISAAERGIDKAEEPFTRELLAGDLAEFIRLGNEILALAESLPQREAVLFDVI